MKEKILEYLDSQGCEVLWDIETHSDEWYNFREEYEGTGGSGAGTMLEINKWRSKYEQFHYDVGLVDRPNIKNESMFWGTTLEPIIREKWCYIDPEQMPNYISQETKVREIYDINKYVINPKYPRLYASPDGIIPMGQKKYRLSEGGKLEFDGYLQKPGILEIKKLSSYSIKEYGGIPEYYIAQVQQYMMVLGCDYAEIVALIDGSKIMLEVVHADKDYQDLILKQTNTYWDLVIKAKKLLVRIDELQEEANDTKNPVQSNIPMEESAKLMAELNAITPDVDNSESLAIFMNKNYIKNAEYEHLQASDIDKAYARRWNLLQTVSKKIDGEIQLVKNNLHAKLFSVGYTTINLGEGKGVVELQTRGKAKTPSLYNKSVKLGDEKEIADLLISRMDIYEFDLD